MKPMENYVKARKQCSKLNAKNSIKQDWKQKKDENEKIKTWKAEAKKRSYSTKLLLT